MFFFDYYNPIKRGVPRLWEESPRVDDLTYFNIVLNLLEGHFFGYCNASWIGLGVFSWNMAR